MMGFATLNPSYEKRRRSGMPGFAFACECMNYSLDREIVQEAKDVVVFRMIGTGVSPDPADHMAVANIAVVDRIRGKSKIGRIRYSISMCCGIR